MATQIQIRRDTAANWTSANPTLASGEIGFITDENQFKIGTGSTDFANLAFAGGSDIGNALTDVNSITSETGSNLTLTADGGQLMLRVDDGDHTAFTVDGGTTVAQTGRFVADEFRVSSSTDPVTTNLVQTFDNNEPLVIRDFAGQITLEVDGINHTVLNRGGVSQAVLTTDRVVADTYNTPLFTDSASGSVVIDHNNGQTQVITLTGDFGLNDIENTAPGDSGVVYFQVLANSDVAYDGGQFGIGGFLSLEGNVGVLENSFPQGGTAGFDRYWRFEYYDIGANQVYVEPAVGPINQEQF